VENVSNTPGFAVPDAEMLEINEKLVIAGVRQQEFAEAARRAEHRLRDLVYGLDAVICEVDVRTGQPSFLSLRAETFLGHPLNRWYSQPSFLTEIVHPSDHERVAALLPTLMEAGLDYNYDFRALSADKDIIWMRNIVSIVRGSEGGIEMLRCVIVDITAQRQTAQKLEAAYAREHKVADTLQRSLLFMPPEYSFPGVSVKTIYESASDEALAGGDFWDTFACDHGNVAFVLGDVMGHGLPAAVFTAELKYTLRGFIREHVTPGRILRQMNSYLHESHRLFTEGLNEQGGDAPICMTLAIIDTATGQGTIASAGMEPPLLVRSDGRMEEINVNGLLLGFELDVKYAEVSFELTSGDWLILTTDGITEARQGKEFLGYEGLMRLVQEGRSEGMFENASVEQLGQAILEGAKAFAGGRLKDDACVLLARRQ